MCSFAHSAKEEFMIKIHAIATCIAASAFGCGSMSDLGTVDLQEQTGSSEQGVVDTSDDTLAIQLHDVLSREGFTGNIQSTLQTRLHRSINQGLANLGRVLWFDKIHALHDDNTCGGCHAPSNGFGDTQSIAIGVQNNNRVGPNRAGPRNQRRTPMAVNTAFFPRLMWNGRFESLSGDPFNNSAGFKFPPPEGTTRFPANDPIVTHLLIAQGHMPPTELIEVAGFTGTRGTISPEFDQFDDGLGSPVPPPDASGFRNDPIRQAVLTRLNGSSAYRSLFAAQFPSVASGGPIDFTMFGRAIAEFEFTLVFANAPIDRFARGEDTALTKSQKLGALLFFGTAGCVRCHAVSGQANEMFSDFQNRVLGVPQVAPGFGVGVGNVIFSGPGQNEDFGLEEITGNSADRYKFRTSPLRNVALQPAFFHNGAFTRLQDAIVHHLDVATSARNYNPVSAGLDADLTHHLGPIEPVLARLDPLVATPIRLTNSELTNLVDFVQNGLLDSRATAANLCPLVPTSVPSGSPVLIFERCP
jgi:cytochrome c peroxidase